MGTSMRRRRVLLVTGPIVGTLGAMLGVAFGTEDPQAMEWMFTHVHRSDIQGVMLANSFAATLSTLAALGVGRARGRPLHALKAAASIAALLFFPGALLGVVLAAAGC